MSLTRELEQKYQGGLENREKSNSFRAVLMTTRHVAPKKYAVAEPLSRYLTILDDLTDSGNPASPALEFIQAERHSLLSGKGSPLQREYLHPAFENLSLPQQTLINRELLLFMKGFVQDVTLRLTQKPLTESQLRTRSFLVEWPAIACFGVIAANAYPRINKGVIRLVDAWCRYDNLRDLTEDLQNGQILISQEDIAKFGIKLQPSRRLPYEELGGYYQFKRALVARDIRKNAGEIFHVGLPMWIAIPSYVYFTSRLIKLFKPMEVSEDAVFNPPSDTLSRYQLLGDSA